MSYELLFLLSFCIIFLASPQKAVMTMAASVAFWIEWRFPGFFGVRAGLVDAAVTCGLLGLLFQSSGRRAGENIPFRGLIASYVFLSVLSPLLSPYVEFKDPMRVFWVSYKEIYVTLSFFLFYLVLSSKEMIQKAINLVLFSAAITSVVGIAQSLSNSSLSVGVGIYKEEIEAISSINEIYGNLRAFGTLWHANEFAGFLILTLSISLAILFIDKQYRFRNYLLFTILTQLVALVLTLSRGGWIGFFGACAIIFLYAKLYRQFSLIPAVIVGITVLVSMYALFPKLDLLPGNVSARVFSVKNYEEDPAMQPRFERWNRFFEVSMERPILGLGTVATEALDEEFLGIAPSPHNTYLSVAVKRGYISLAIIIIIIISSAFHAKMLFESASDNFYRAVGLGTFAGFCGLFGIAGIFGSFLEETQVNILFWFLMAVMLRSRRLSVDSSRIKPAVGD